MMMTRAISASSKTAPKLAHRSTERRGKFTANRLFPPLTVSHEARYADHKPARALDFAPWRAT